MILDSKVHRFPPPPSDADATTLPPFSRSASSPHAMLAVLPPHILLHIVYLTFPQTPSIDQGKVERQRKTLLWLVNSLRLVNRSFYIACMHVLRSIYLPAYQSLIRPPYTSDPFPTTTSNARSPTYSEPSSSTTASQPITSIQRETLILDHFIALKVREDVLVDESELHLEREDMFKDLFEHAQPKARLEDLVRRYGVRNHVISSPGTGGGTADGQQRESSAASDLLTANPSTAPSSSLSPVRRAPSSPTSRSSRFLNFFSSSARSGKSSAIPATSTAQQQQSKIRPIPFSSITISLAPRTISLIVGSGANRRTMAQVKREGRDMKLEVGAKMLIKELKEVLLAEAE